MKYFSKIKFNSSSNWIQDEDSWNKKLWESEHTLYTMCHTHRILGSHDENSDLRKITLESKHLSEEDFEIPHNVLSITSSSFT